MHISASRSQKPFQNLISDLSHAILIIDATVFLVRLFTLLFMCLIILSRVKVVLSSFLWNVYDQLPFSHFCFNV